MLEVKAMSSNGQEFSGPVRLLLDIVRDGEFDILELRIVEVIDAYLAQLDDLPLEEITDFLVVAATLMQLKSRCLLPEDADEDLLDDLYRWEEKGPPAGPPHRMPNIPPRLPAHAEPHGVRSPFPSPAKSPWKNATGVSTPTRWKAPPLPTCWKPTSAHPTKK